MTRSATQSAPTIPEAQWEMRSAFLGGFAGQLVSAVLWAGSAALSTWSAQRHGIVFIVVAGVFIFPLTQATLRAMGRPGRVGPDNALYGLGAQVAAVLPLVLPVVGAAALARQEWFYPALMIALGAHYLPFVFLYGMPLFGALAAILWSAGLALGLWIELPFAAGAWLTAGVLLLFALAGARGVLAEERSRAASPPLR